LDDIEAAFADITPEDFIRDTSAIWTTRYQELPERNRPNGTSGRKHFNDFVEAMLKVCRVSSTTKPEGFRSFSVIHNAEQQRIFHVDDDETFPDFADRLTRESRAIHGTWIFTAILSQGRTYTDEAPPPIDTSVLEEIQRALDNGEVQPGICWSATMREGTTVFNRGGILYLDQNGRITSEVEGDLDPESNLFGSVLEG
jgi:hypothetical protein